jgi:tetratricopeptide (TPR) repeat protein
MKEHSFSENNDLLPDLFAENAEELPADSALRRLIQGDETADEQAELLRQRGNQRYRLGCRLLDRGNDPGPDLTLPGGEQSVATLRKRAHALFHQAMASYTEALALPGVSSTVRGALYLNRAEVHRRLGNYARGLHDAQQCIRSCGLEHPKAFYRASACALALGKLPEARTFCQQGLERTKAPEHVLERRALQRLEERIAEEMVRAQRLLAEKDALLQQRVDQSQRLLDTLERQRIRLGMPLFAQQKKVSNWQPKPVPVARDEPNPDSESTVSIKFSWPFMVVYPLVQRSDFFENVDDDAELQALFSDLLPVEGPPALTFDPEGRYRCDRVAFW